MTENEPIKAVSDGITFLSTGRYYDGINQWIAHSIKEGDTDAIDYAARRMAPLVPAHVVLVPIPGHHGVADQTLRLAQALSSYTHLPFVDALRGREHESQYEAKRRGHLLSGRDMGFYQREFGIRIAFSPLMRENADCLFVGVMQGRRVTSTNFILWGIGIPTACGKQVEKA